MDVLGEDRIDIFVEKGSLEVFADKELQSIRENMLVHLDIPRGQGRVDFRDASGKVITITPRDWWPKLWYERSLLRIFGLPPTASVIEPLAKSSGFLKIVAAEGAVAITPQSDFLLVSFSQTEEDSGKEVGRIRFQ